MDQITLSFTQQEVMALQQLLHRAVQHSGMEVAEAAVVINIILQNALKAKADEQPQQQSRPQGNGGSEKRPSL